jgi:hypothetical protein
MGAFGRASGLLLALLLSFAIDFPGAAQFTAGATAGDFYQANAVVTGTDMRQRPWGFAECLREVLIKVSGDPRLRNDPRVAELGKQADKYVISFDYADLMAGIPKKDDQGSYDRPHRLTVHFDPARIDALVKQLGDNPWRGDRPVIVPVLLVRGPHPPPYVLSALDKAGAEQRSAFTEAASEYGMTVRIPSETELAAWGAVAEHFPLLAQTPPVDPDPGEVLVVGTLDWHEDMPGWVGAWRTRWHGDDYRWGISGVNYDAAFRDIVAGVVRLASGNAGTADASLPHPRQP